jgi:hypothetical protein
MHDDHHIASALQCHSTPNRTTFEVARRVSVKALYLALIVGGVYASTRPNVNEGSIQFIAACQNLTKKRSAENPLKDVFTQSSCAKQDIPPSALAQAGSV